MKSEPYFAVADVAVADVAVADVAVGAALIMRHPSFHPQQVWWILPMSCVDLEADVARGQQ
jgi:hypothetical protein